MSQVSCLTVMLDVIDNLLSTVSAYLWGYVLIFALLGVHLYLTVVLRVPQRYLFHGLVCSLNRKSEGNSISQYASLAVSLAANIGTGNIVGVAVALASGGPGAVFWCMITGVLGMSSRYAESLLSVRFRCLDDKGNLVGGPMYAIEQGMKCKWLAVVFAVFAAIAAFGVGNVTQANAAARVLNESAMSVPTWFTGALLSVLVALVLMGGLRGIARVCSAFVPIMTIVYIIGCVLVLAVHADYVLPALQRIWDCAFTNQAAAGGFIGSTIMLAMQVGVRRGLFSNEAGLGSSAIVSAAADTPNSVKQAVVASTAPFWDSVVLCTLTGVTLTTAGLAEPYVMHAPEGELIVFYSFSSAGGMGTILLTFSLVTFVISSILAWSYFGERAVQYLSGQRHITLYRLVWVVAVFVGCIIPQSGLVWHFADCANALMAIPNLICLIWLTPVLIAESRSYLWSGQLNAVDDTLVKPALLQQMETESEDVDEWDLQPKTPEEKPADRMQKEEKSN
ncbi:MAG: sodium:alanine symporter family protein [Akkermansia sp.]|nr:sodium:alanine symporter family protein [Akkermansia sp.]